MLIQRKYQNIQFKQKRSIVMKQHRHYHFLILPHPQQRYKSLKTSHSHFNKQPLLVKRKSLDSKPIANMRKQHTFENIEDIIYSNKVGNYLSNKPKGYLQDSNKTKYYWKKKQPKPKSSKLKQISVKRTWSQFGKNVQQKNNGSSYYSRSKNDENHKINNSDRFDNKKQFLNKMSNETGQTSKSYHSKNQIKKVKSLFNSTMLTKRDLEDCKEPKELKYQNLISTLKKILNKYQIRVSELKQQRNFYRSKYKKAVAIKKL